MAQIAAAPELLEYKLGTALGLERKAHTMLGTMESKASLGQLQEGFARHREETQRQITNLEQALEAIGGDTTAHQDAVMDGIADHAEQMLGRVDESLVDSILAGGAADTEHHEIATYEGLITLAEALGEDDVVTLLEENLEQEQRTLKEVETVLAQLAQEAAQQPAR
jgi:ferritin-like metal-binding protein YciE